MDEDRRKDYNPEEFDAEQQPANYDFSAAGLPWSNGEVPTDSSAASPDKTVLPPWSGGASFKDMEEQTGAANNMAANNGADPRKQQRQDKKSGREHHYTQVKEVGRGTRKRKFGIVLSVVVGLVLVGLIGFGGGLLAANRLESRMASNLDELLAENGGAVLYRSVDTTTNVTGQKEELSVAEVAELCADSVVEIATETSVSSWSMFGRSSYLVPGAGSGIIISDTGHILTCYHVIEDAQTISVRLSNGESYQASVLAYDEQSDVAIIKIDSESELTPVVFGSSDNLVLGDEVVAIGNPLGELGGSVTEGIISGLDREVSIQDKGTFTVLQTSAAINGGNSGGGLFNMQGELIGMVNAKAEDVGVEGLGFALPIDDIKGIIEDLLNYGYVTERGVSLGVALVDINDERTATSYRVDEFGCYILRVDSGSNAAYAGLQSGDRIVSIDGEKIDSGDQVVEIISGHSANDVITMVIKRNGQQMEIKVTLYGAVPDGATTTSLS